MNDFIIETKQLTKNYGEQAAVNSVSLHVKKGQIYGLLGRNGAGKTTIMKMILGLTSITYGEADVFGQNIKGREKRIYPILEREFNLKDYSVGEEQTLRLYDTTLDIGKINKVLVMQDVTVISSGLYHDTLEDYFKKITGGEGIA